MTNPTTAHLGEDYGYRLDGDTVHLHASFLLEDPLTEPGPHSLQLWACEELPIGLGAWRGSAIAELPLPPFYELWGEPKTFAGSCFVSPPASSREHFLVLALCSGEKSPVVDFKPFASTQTFLQPSFVGNVEALVTGDHLHCKVERIENPRDAGTTSGTLSLELWALSQPYRGGAFQGVPLGGVALDAISGQESREGLSLEIAALERLTEESHPVLMLREWTPMGYVTRDFVSLDREAMGIQPKSDAQVPVELPVTLPAEEKVPEAAVVLPAEEEAPEAVEPLPVEEKAPDVVKVLRAEEKTPEVVEALPVEEKTPEVADALPVEGKAPEAVEALPVVEKVAPEAVIEQPKAVELSIPEAEPEHKKEPEPAVAPIVAKPPTAPVPAVTSPSGFSPSILSPTRPAQPGLWERLKAWLESVAPRS